MSLTQKISILPKAWRQLGPGTLWFFAKYQLKLRSGWLRWKTPGGPHPASGLEPRDIVRPAAKEDFESLLGKRTAEIFKQADEILSGDVRLFGTEPRPLELQPPKPLQHWTHFHNRLPSGEDIKPLWEAGRFSWATVLARAYWLSAEERYAEGFWKYFEEFIAANPPNLGPHWSSAQEVALRLISFAFCCSLLAGSRASTEARRRAMADAVIAHAKRIPPTLDYALAQNNNHLLSEALGLATAAAVLPDHPSAPKWRSLGFDLFRRGIEKQIHADGAYAQHSSNYQRLMLQLGVWACILAEHFGEPLGEQTRQRLARANDWLGTLLDESGRVPNLGPNDGAYILPVSVLPFEDHRPALGAGSRAFGGSLQLEAVIWDEMALWLGLENGRQSTSERPNGTPIRIEGKESWAYLRAADFRERPGHADQLHLDLWWRGLNIAGDAGSYLYTAPPPWDNALASARVHNTITINEREPMLRAGRFLWLDWAQAKNISTGRGKGGQVVSAAAEHAGYRKLNVLHRREVSWDAGSWVVTDRLLPFEESEQPVRARLHWLLPDWDCQAGDSEIRMASPHGEIALSIDVSAGAAELRLIRAGELVHGSGTADPVLGWSSPTYGVKVPALSFLADIAGPLPITIVSTWSLPGQ